METANKKYYLDTSELAVLMVNSGIRNIYGLGSKAKLDNKDICMVMHSLYNNKLIENYNQEAFVINAEIRRLLGNIKESVYVVTINGEKEVDLRMCCYLGTEITIVSSGEKDREKVCIYSCGVDSLIEEILNVLQEDKVLISIKLASTGEEVEGFRISNGEKPEFISECIEKYYKGGSNL